MSPMAHTAPAPASLAAAHPALARVRFPEWNVAGYRASDLNPVSGNTPYLYLSHASRSAEDFALSLASPMESWKSKKVWGTRMASPG